MNRSSWSTRRTAAVIAAVALSAAAVALSAAGSAAPAVAQADVVSDWNAIAQAETVLLRPTAHGQSRGIAMVEGAVYDAVNAINRGHQPYLLDLDEVGAQPWGSQDAAAATAAYRVLLAITPPARHAGLDDAHAATLATIPDGAIKQEGVEAGEAAAEAMLAARENDGFLATFTPSIGTDPGDWRPIGWPDAPVFDPDGWVGNLKPFLIKSLSQFRSEGPNALTSAAYAEDFAEVKELGAQNSSTRTADQTAAAVFWQFAPIALWNPLARELAARYDLDAADQARLYAMVNLAAADAAIACWNDKYYWSFWRPRAAIREADTDGNPATIADPNWESLFAPSTQTTPPLGTPPFPDHPSGHGCLSGAVLNTFADFFGTDKVAFRVVSGRSLNGVPIPPRQFDRFSQALKEIIDARVWGGIHFRTADVQGTVIGKKVAHWLRKHYFKPVQ
jgi:PAP2 superfamily